MLIVNASRFLDHQVGLDLRSGTPEKKALLLQPFDLVVERYDPALSVLDLSQQLR